MAQPRTNEATVTETQSEQKLEHPRMWRVLLHNDDYTTQDFVVWCWRAFSQPRGEAFEIMMSSIDPAWGSRASIHMTSPKRR